jgi:hypothetical protein
MATYTATAATVDAVRFFHGNDVFGLSETTDTSSGVARYFLTVPHADGDLTIPEGYWVLRDQGGIYHVCPDDIFRTMFAQ